MINLLAAAEGFKIFRLNAKKENLSNANILRFILCKVILKLCILSKNYHNFLLF